MWAALGLVYLWESLAVVLGSEKVRVGTDTFDLPTKRSWLLTSPLLAIAFVPMVGNWQASSRAGETDTADFAIDLLNSVEPYGILVTVGDNDTFPLWYAQEVLGVRKDVTVANTSLLNTDWYTRQLIRRPVYEYDEANGPAIFRGKQWKKPEGPAIKMTMDEADRLPPYQELTTAQRFGKGQLQTVIQPRVLARADILVLRMLLDNDDRAIHFSRTSGGLAEQLGLGEFAVMQGHTRKVVTAPVVESANIVRVPGEGFVDVERSVALWKEMKTPESLIKKGDWVDAPSKGIPFLIVSTGVATAEALMRSGRQEEANAVLDRSRNVATAMKFGQIVNQLVSPPPTPSGDTQVRTPVPAKP